MTLTIEIDSAHGEGLRAIAAAQGRDVGELAREALIDYVDLRRTAGDSPADWAEASVAMSGEFLGLEHWPQDEASHEPR